MAMPIAWQAGYDWAYSCGSHAELGCCEAIEAHGWDLIATEADQFMKGVDCAQSEQLAGDPA